MPSQSPRLRSSLSRRLPSQARTCSSHLKLRLLQKAEHSSDEKLKSVSDSLSRRSSERG